MEFLELAKQRRSVRGFTGQSVPDDAVRKILEAAVEAPSGGNRQPWHFYVIRDKAVIAEIHEKAYRAGWFASAPVVFAVCADAERSGAKHGDRGRALYCIQDTAAAVQNMLLCAKSLGVDTCWCGAFDERAVSEILDLPQNHRPVALIPAGFAASGNPKPARRPMEEVVTYID